MFEQGVIRPPSEASSLLVRVTRNCPWNRCHVCPAFKGKRFSLRSVEEVKHDLDQMKEVYGNRSKHFTSAFLQDADSLILPTADLIEIISYIKLLFPNIERMTTYARAKSMKRKSVSDYRRLKAAGLTRVHNGMESGSINVLKLINKGIKPEDIETGGSRVMEAGISLSEYIMPGVGGRALSREHAVETARILNRIRPNFIRVRTFAIHPMSPMQKMVSAGTFEPMTDAEVVAEIRLLLEQLDEMPSHFRCGDFSLNLLMQVDGRLDTHKAEMLRELDRFLNLSEEQQKVYSLLRRSYPGHQSLDIVNDKAFMAKALHQIETLENREPDGFNKHIRTLMSYQLPQPQTDCWN